MDHDIKAAVDGVQAAFADFKKANDERLAKIEAGQAHADVTAKVEAINSQIDKLTKAADETAVKMAAIEMSGKSAARVKDQAYTEAFGAFMKKGDIQAALNKGTDSEGGYLAPVEWDRTITDKLTLLSPMRQICRVQSISTNGFKKLFNLGGTASGWVGETTARPNTAAATFAELTYATGEIYANPAATQQILDDSAINLESWIAGEVQTQFALQEGVAFLSGDGVNKPTGLLTYVTGGTNAAAHPFGAIQVVNSGAAASITSDAIIDMIYSLPSVFLGNARFIMNRTTQGVVRKLKDGQGNYLWQPSYVAGQPATLAGYPVTEIPDMPNVAANSLAIGFGDFNQGYLIVDRVGVRVLRDPYTNKPYVSFYTTKRVGGGLLNPEPLRFMKIGTGA